MIQHPVRSILLAGEEISGDGRYPGICCNHLASLVDSRSGVGQTTTNLICRAKKPASIRVGRLRETGRANSATGYLLREEMVGFVYSEAAVMRSAGKEQSACQLKWEEGEEGLMRFMITCRIPVEKGNESAKAGSLHSTIQSIMEDLKP
jgi:hypothetical protein